METIIEFVGQIEIHFQLMAIDFVTIFKSHTKENFESYRINELIAHDIRYLLINI